jgi:hypothetical protein
MSIDRTDGPTIDPSINKPRNDVYTGMLMVSLLALVTGCILLFLDYSQYPASKAPDVRKVSPISSPKVEKAEPAPAPVPAPAPGAEDKKGEEKKGMP